MRIVNRENLGRPWSKQDLLKLKKLYEGGKSIEHIAKKLDRNLDAITYRLIKSGFLGFPEEKDTINHGRIWPESDSKLLLKLFSERKTIPFLAKKFGRKKNAVLFRLIKLNAFDFTDRSELINLSKGKPISKKSLKNKREELIEKILIGVFIAVISSIIFFLIRELFLSKLL